MYYNISLHILIIQICNVQRKSFMYKTTLIGLWNGFISTTWKVTDQCHLPHCPNHHLSEPTLKIYEHILNNKEFNESNLINCLRY